MDLDPRDLPRFIHVSRGVEQTSSSWTFESLISRLGIYEEEKGNEPSDKVWHGLALLSERGLGFLVSGLGFRVSGRGLRVEGEGSRIED